MPVLLRTGVGGADDCKYQHDVKVNECVSCVCVCTSGLDRWLGLRQRVAPVTIARNTVSVELVEAEQMWRQQLRVPFWVELLAPRSCFANDAFVICIALL